MCGRYQKRYRPQPSVQANWKPYSALTFLEIADLRFAALFLCRTPLLTALSSFRLAATRAAAAASLSVDSTAVLTARMAVFSSDLTALLRRRAFSLVRMRFFWDLIFATCELSF